MALPSDALSSIGSDLSFAVSFAIANELLAGAREQQIDDSELIGILLVMSVCASATPRVLYALGKFGIKGLQMVTEKLIPSSNPLPPADSNKQSTKKEETKETKEMAEKEKRTNERPSGLLGFLAFLLQILQRISLTVTIQLVTASVQASQPVRSVRILSLLSVLFFFVFLKSTATVGAKN